MDKRKLTTKYGWIEYVVLEYNGAKYFEVTNIKTKLGHRGKEKEILVELVKIGKEIGMQAMILSKQYIAKKKHLPDFTKKNTNYWVERELDWAKSYWDIDHPHRKVFANIEEPESVLEIGCGCGANLKVIQNKFPDVELAGIDINKEAIKEAKLKLPEADLKVGNATKIPFERKFDLVITDALLIYIGRRKITKVLKEIRRVGKKVMFVEFHTIDKERRKTLEISDNYYAYNYNRLLKDFKDVKVEQLPKGTWLGEPWESSGYIITATCNK